MKKTYFILTFILCCSLCFAQNAVRLKAEIERMKADTDLSHASWGICVLDAKKDTIITEYNSSISLLPASTEKIITTASALAILGWNFQYTTTLEYDGRFDSITGIIHGNLYIKGSGDPTLDSETFKKKSDTVPLTDQWAEVLKKKGIKKIQGGVIADATIFEDETIPYGWAWADMGNYYGAGTTGLNFKDNKFSLYFQSGKKNGDTAVITKISPPVHQMKVLNFVRSKGYSDNAYIYGSPYSLVRYVKGTIPLNKKDYEVEGSMPDPPLFCAQSLDSSLRKAGISIGKKSTVLKNMFPPTEEFITTDDSVPAAVPQTIIEKDVKLQRIPVYTQTSHTLDKIVYQTNIQSNNLYAETLLKTIAWKKTKYGDDMTGIDIVTNFWKEKGVPLKGFYMADGCGLSRFNAVSTKQLSEILRTVSLDSAWFNKFYNSLPIAGKSGSLGKLCKRTLAENNIHAKSGYMTRVRSYAGYCTSKKGNLMTFAIIVNNYDCTAAQMKDKLEKLMIAIAEID